MRSLRSANVRTMVADSLAAEICGPPSDRGDTVVFDVMHYVGDLMSVNHVTRGYPGGVRGTRTFGGRRQASTAARHCRGPRRRPKAPEPQHRQPRRYGHDGDGHGERHAIKQVRVQQVHTVPERFIVTRRAMFHTVAP